MAHDYRATFRALSFLVFAAAAALANMALAAPVDGGTLCEQTFLDPSTGDPTTLAVLIETPLPGADLRNWEGACDATVSGIASAVGIPPRFDFYLIIDVSGSTSYGSGVDLDGDGYQDTILEAEIAAARAFINAIDLTLHSVAIVMFDDRSYLVQELTSDRASLSAALDTVASHLYGGWTNFGAPMETALDEHGAHHDPTREQAILFLSDGRPNEPWSIPPGPRICADSNEECTGIEWAEEAGDRGVVVNAFAVGSGADPSVLSRMARAGEGQFFQLDVAGEIASILPTVIHVGVRSVDVLNRTTMQQRTATLSPDGRFSATLPVAPGRNVFVVTAHSDHADAWQVACETDASFTCIQHGCPAGALKECEADGEAYFGDLAAWASIASVNITNDSLHDSDAPGDADASGWYPVGDTRITWTFREEIAGERSCSAIVSVRDTTPPDLMPLNPGARASCTNVPATSVSATDSCDPSPRLELDEHRVDGPCPDSYDLVRDWTATDAWGNVTTLRELLEVRDEEAPVLVGLPADETLECPAMPAPVNVTATDGCDPSPLVTLDEQELPGRCAGERVIHRTWTASDRCGNAVSASRVVTISDTTPPIITASGADNICAWPPRHDQVRIEASAFHPTVSDACDAGPTWRLAACTSNQPDNGRGDGHTDGDCVVSDDGAALLVRVERSGVSDGHVGRVYTVLIVAVDACGNATAPTPVGTVAIPHDRSKHDHTCQP